MKKTGDMDKDMGWVSLPRWEGVNDSDLKTRTYLTREAMNAVLGEPTGKPFAQKGIGEVTFHIPPKFRKNLSEKAMKEQMEMDEKVGVRMNSFISKWTEIIAKKEQPNPQELT